MKISSIIDIIDGEELNSPSISFIYSFKTKASKIKEGDLFFAKNKDDIKLAIDNGAFAIVVDTNIIITDYEIAWIKVDNLDEAMIKLIRFRLSNYDLNVYYCDYITFEYIKTIKNSHQTNIKLIDNNLDESLKLLSEIDNNYILVFSDKKLMNKLYPKNSSLKLGDLDIKNIVEHTIFETSFTFNDIYFSKIRIPRLYLDNFILAYNFLNDKEIDLSKIKNSSFLKPIFVDKHLHQLEYGKSNKFIIVQENLDLIENEINYLKSNYKYAKTLYITSKYINNFFAKQHIIEDVLEIKDFLKTQEFNAAYIIGHNYDKLQEEIKVFENQPTLL